MNETRTWNISTFRPAAERQTGFTFMSKDDDINVLCLKLTDGSSYMKVLRSQKNESDSCQCCVKTNKLNFVFSRILPSP